MQTKSIYSLTQLSIFHPFILTILELLYMTDCDYSQLVQIHKTIQKIMNCLSISTANVEVTNQESDITSLILNNLYKTLNHLLYNEVSQGNQDNQTSGEMYQNIQKQLQRQENLNRLLIKKELQFKEYQKSLLDDLNEERKKVKDLQGQLNRINDRILTKDLQILHLNNEKKMISKDKKANKEMMMIETLVNERKIGDPFKSIKQSINLHQRRKSDELTKRPSTANPKKKGSMTKR